MTPEAMRALPERLRAVESRSKAGLLEEAAAAIEALLHTLDELQWNHDKLVSFELAESKELAAAVAELKELDTDCLVCDHNHREAPCEGTDYGCYDGCPFECPCKGCKDNSKWTWHGRGAK